MTTALAVRTGLPGTLRDQSYTLPPNLTLDEWGRLLRTVDFLVEASPWFLADVMAYGEARFGEEHAQALPGPDEDPYGASESRIKQAAWMASVYPPGTRVPLASYTHHRIAADLPPVTRRAMLQEVAAAEQRVRDGVEGAVRISTRELGRRVKVEQEALKGHAITASGELVEAPDLGWVPTREDLAPDARRDLEVKLSEMSAAKRSTFEAGVLWAWQYADDLELFARDGES